MERERREDDSLIRAAPALARMAVRAYVRSLRWAAETGLHAARDLVQEPSPHGDPNEEAHDEPPSAARPDEASARTLRKRGEELLRLSADVRYEEDSHPAFARILDELAPDEARILRFLRESGPQPAVDVRSGGPLGVGIVATEMVAPGLNMIGAEAGVRHLDRLPAYLNNLYRLGLIWFSREAVSDHLRYQVLEAQPEVTAALAEAGRGARTVRRSIHVTPFGADFCELCLPATTAEFEALRQSERDGAPPGDPRTRTGPGPAGAR